MATKEITEDSKAESNETGEEITDLESDIQKEIAKLDYYTEQVDELIETEDYKEMKVITSRVEVIQNRISDLIGKIEEMKIEQGLTSRSVRQWKKETKEKYSHMLAQNDKLCKVLSQKECEINEENLRKDNEKKEREQLREEKRILERQKQLAEMEEKMRQERFEQEKAIMEERIKAEIKLAEKKLEIEYKTKASYSKLPELKVTPFNGTMTDWVRFSNMFSSQVLSKGFSDEIKFGYLLEMVNPRVREKIANLKPGKIGLETAWERLNKEFGQKNAVINTHIDEIINLPTVRGTNYEKVLDFYNRLTKNCDALLTLGENNMLKGFVMTTLNKLPSVKPDIVRIDQEWESWDMDKLIENLQNWLRRNKIEGIEKPVERKERHWYTGEREKRTKICVYCDSKDHWSDKCVEFNTLEKRRVFFRDNKLCFNCAKKGHRGDKCESRGCYFCKSKHHSSLCEKLKDVKGTVLTGFTPCMEESLPPMLPVKIQGKIFWAILDSGSGRDFISKEAVMALKLKPERFEIREVTTVNGTRRKSMPIFNVIIESLDDKAKEDIEVTGLEMKDLTTIKRPDLRKLKKRFDHTKDKEFYLTETGNHTIHIILGDKTFCKIKTESVFKGEKDEPIVEGTTFGWVIHGGDYPNINCLFTRESSEYERLYSLDVLGVEDRGENDQLDVFKEFKENVTRQEDGRYNVNVPWIPGMELTETNEAQSRKRLYNVERRMRNDEKLQAEYAEIVESQLRDGVIEKVPSEPSGSRIFYMPHKPVLREDASTTKCRMVFDASARPAPLMNSINDCMYKGPALQPNIWDIMIRARMAPCLLVGDLKQAFLQIGIKPEDRDAFRFLFTLNGKEEHLRFMRIPFGGEASPFMLGGTLQYHYEQFDDPELVHTLEMLKVNTYVDNLMCTGTNVEDLEKFKTQATDILKDGKFTIHKWESNVEKLDSENMGNPSKILGHI